MDPEYDFQPLSSKSNGKPLQSSPQTNTAQFDESQEQALDLAWLLAVLRRRATVMAGVALALTIITGSFIVWKSKSVRPTYEGSFRLLVEPITAQGRLAQEFLTAQTEAGTDIQKIRVDETALLDYETQIRVLRSPVLIEPILKQIQTQYPGMSYDSLLGKLSISRVKYEKDGKQQGTKILQVNYLDLDPEKINFVLDKVAKAYLKYSLDQRQTSLRQGITFLEKQLPDMYKQVNTVQEQLQSLREQYNLIDPEVAGNSLSEHALLIQRQRLDTEAQLAETRSLYATLQGLLNNANTTALLAKDANAYETLLGQIQKLETQIAIDSSVFREDSAPMQMLREQQQNLQRLSTQEAQEVLEKLAGQIQGLEERYQTIAKTENQVNQQISNLPEAARRHHDLEQKLEVATDNLKEFLKKREALRLDAAQQEVPWQLIDGPKIPRNAEGEPIPAESAQTKRQLLIAAILSSLLGIGVGFLIEVLDTVFHSPEDLKGVTRLPILGMIPLTKQVKKLSHKSQKLAIVAKAINSVLIRDCSPVATNGNTGDRYRIFPFLEAFRSLYTNIHLLRSKKPIHSLSISSAVPGDGKTTVAVYLAQTAAAIGQKVLLVDADLRFPQLHHRLELPNVTGLHELITTDLNLDDIIQKPSPDENFFVLTAGQTVPDPIKLLSSDKMQYLMDQFQARFDLVIYDTPPLLGLGDGNLLAAKADGTLLVVAIDKTDRTMLMKAFDGLKIAGASVLGIVANGVQNHAISAYAPHKRTIKNPTSILR
ncbi:MAG TPA: capsular biosynthesis protein [Cyanobacteria bacterium UBA9273]|nr:capsular biosynthesis protein [Cyanobacteria bacterium UBA9273]